MKSNHDPLFNEKNSPTTTVAEDSHSKKIPQYPTPEELAQQTINRQKARFNLWDFGVAVCKDVRQFFLYDDGNYVDYINTYFRSLEVYSNICANQTDSDAENNGSVFNWLFKKKGESSEFTTAGIIAFSLGMLSTLIGPFVSFYNWCRAEQVVSMSYLIGQLRRKKIVPDEMSDDEVEQIYIKPTYVSLLKRYKVAGYVEAPEDISNPKTEDSSSNSSDIKLEFNDQEEAERVHIRLRSVVDAETFEQNLKDEYESSAFSKFALAMGILDSANDVFSMGILNKDDSWNDLSLWEKIKSWVATLSTSVKTLWDAVNDNGFSFWLVWFPFALKFGITAASGILYLPIIVSISIGTWLTLTIAKVAIKFSLFAFKYDETLPDEYMLFGLLKKPKIRWKTDADRDIESAAEKQHEAERDRDNKLLYRVFMKLDHKNKSEKLKNKNYKGYLSPEELSSAEKDKKKKITPPPVAPKYFDVSREEIENSSLGSHLLEGSTTIYILSTITEVVNAIILASFAFWMLSSVIMAFGAFIPGLAIAKTGIFSFLSSNISAGYTGFGLAAWLGIKGIAQIKREQMDREQRIHKVLSEEYKDTGESRLDYFVRNERIVDFRKAQAEWLRLQVLAQYDTCPRIGFWIDKFKDLENIDNNVSAADYKAKYAALHAQREFFESRLRSRHTDAAFNQQLDKRLNKEFDLDKIDVYNSDYRNRLTEEPDAFTTAENVVRGTHTFLAGVQTGSLLARTLFLQGCVLGLGSLAAIAGAAATGGTLLIAFIAIAAVIAIGFGIVCVLKTRNQRMIDEQESILKNPDVMNSYLHKNDKELTLNNANLLREVKGVHTTEKQQDIKPAQKIVVNDKSMKKSNQKFFDVPVYQQSAVLNNLVPTVTKVEPTASQPSNSGTIIHSNLFSERLDSLKKSRDNIAELEVQTTKKASGFGMSSTADQQ